MDSVKTRPTVMIVDMDAAFRSQCAQALKKQNIEVVAEADNGHDAYLLSLRTKPKVILCDLYVGKMDGVQLLKDLHKQLVDEETSFIMLASFTNQNLFEECCNAGATYCMIKPLDYSLLAERIERICDKKRRRAVVKAQEELDEREYSAQAGGGMVSVTVSGKRELKHLEIKPECVDPEDVEMLQDMILAAVNEALRNAEETRNAEMAKLAPGMGGMF